MKRWLLTACLALGLLTGAVSGAGAVVQDESRLDAETREIAKTLRCTVCQNESIWDSKAELAHQMREIIRERLARGESPEAIRAYFLSRYGEYILLEPRKGGMNWLLWGGPFVLLIVGGGLLYRVLRRWTAQTADIPSETLAPLDEKHRLRIEDELRSSE
ncbi:MAG: cytochrome c-type biogenesis protein CcmH [Nitrospirae bacterium]|nr:cytochrome c-type biogenesis protein CcmH [Nitrospirota bacterium]